jgi:tetratricopeptide (TPR) repeat protein
MSAVAAFDVVMRLQVAGVGICIRGDAVTDICFLPRGAEEVAPAHTLAARVYDAIRTYLDDPALQFDYYIIKGKALRELGRCEEAIPLLQEGNKLYNSDTRLLNALGYCYYRSGQKTLALEVLNASLRLNPDQPDIKKLIEEVGAK